MSITTKTLLPALAAFAFASSASASLIFDAGVQFSSQGFGNAPRDLTVHENVSTQSGCVGIDPSGNLTFGSAACTPDSSVHDANSQTNVGGSEENPLADNQKFGAPTAASLG